MITVEKSGFEEENIYLGKNLQAGYVVLDIALCLTGLGCASLIVDAVTRAWNKFDRSYIDVDLEQKK